MLPLTQTGAPTPELIRNSFATPTAVNAKLPPALYTTAPAVGLKFALVPPFAMGNIPVTSVVKLTALHVGDPAAFPCNTCTEVPAAVDAIVVVVGKYNRPY